MKTYNKLNDVEMHIIRQYEEYKKISDPILIEYKLTNLDIWMKRAKELNIQHLLIQKEVR